MFGCLHFLSLFSPHLSPSTVWQNRGDRQYPQPRLCAKVHLGLLFWGEAESTLWFVSGFLWNRVIIGSSLLPSSLICCDEIYRFRWTEDDRLTPVNPAEKRQSNHAVPLKLDACQTLDFAMCLNGGFNKSNTSYAWRILCLFSVIYDTMNTRQGYFFHLI